MCVCVYTCIYIKLEKLWCFLRSTCICFPICGPFFAGGDVAADVLRNGHGQDIWWLLRQRLKRLCVSPPKRDPRDRKLERVFHTWVVVATTEDPELETLLGLC